MAQDPTRNAEDNDNRALARRAAFAGIGALGATLLAACQDDQAPSALGTDSEALTADQDYAADVSRLTGYVNPASYPVVTLLGYYQPGDGGGGVFYWDSPCSLTPDNGMTFASTMAGMTGGRWRRICPDGLVSVKWFGAYGDATNPTTTREAIQAAIDYVAAAYWPSGVVYLPGNKKIASSGAVTASVYRIDDQSVVLPRVSNVDDTQVIIRGDSREASCIQSLDGADVFVTDPSTSNTWGGHYRLEHMCFSLTGSVRALIWNVVSAPLKLDMFNVKIFAQQDGEADCDGVVSVYGLDRGTFREVDVYFQDGGGAAIAFDIIGKATFTNCRTLLRGAFIKFAGAELVMIGNRCEGATGIPSWQFYNPAGTTWPNWTSNITIINAGNEGSGEFPAIMQFSGCRNVVVINPQLATADVSQAYGSGYIRADGIRFDEACEACQVIGPCTGGTFAQAGFNTAYLYPDTANRQPVAVYATPDTTYITVTGATSRGASLPEYEFLLLGKESFAEAIYSYSGTSTRVAGTKLTQITQIREVASVGTPPSDAGFLYIDSSDGKLKFKGRSGTVTVLANP